MKLVLSPTLAQPIQQLPLTVTVTNYLSPDNERVFNFAISVVGKPACWQFSGRYSELRKMERNVKIKVRSHVSCPSLPYRKRMWCSVHR